MYPLASNFDFRGVIVSMTPVLKIRTPLPLLPMEIISMENVGHVLAELETEAKRILGSFG
jgi:hypothetical protein